MFVIIAYDINTETKDGQKRLRKVSKICSDYGVRVQKSVFECVVDMVQFLQLQQKINEIIDLDTDSISYYNFSSSQVLMKNDGF